MRGSRSHWGRRRYVRPGRKHPPKQARNQGERGGLEGPDEPVKSRAQPHKEEEKCGTTKPHPHKNEWVFPAPMAKKWERLERLIRAGEKTIVDIQRGKRCERGLVGTELCLAGGSNQENERGGGGGGGWGLGGGHWGGSPGQGTHHHCPCRKRGIGERAHSQRRGVFER